MAAKRVAHGLIVHEVDAETLVFDSRTDQVHLLDDTCRAVWERCDGRETAGSIARRLSLTEEAVEASLAQLARAKLVTVEGVSRRTVLRGAALAGGAAVAGPTLISMVAPTAAVAASAGGGGGTATPSTPFKAAVLATSPYLYYQLNATGGSTAADSSGNGRDGSYGSNVTLNIRDPATGDSGDTAVSVSLNEGAIGVGHGGTVPSADWSVAAFVKATYPAGGTGSTAMPIMGLGSSSGGGNVAYLNVDGGDLAVGVDTWAGQTVLGTEAFLDGSWHYLVLTWDGTARVFTLYVDGSEFSSGGAVFGGNNAGNGSQAYWGFCPLDHSYEGGYAGEFDEVAIWDRVLSSTEIATIYAAR